MTQHIGDILGKPRDVRKFGTSTELIDSETYIGIEVELENVYVNTVSETCGLLSATNDYSLRGENCGEILFSMPLKGNDVIEAINGIDEYIQVTESKPIMSSRTSTHVHIDVRDMSLEELRKFIIVYLSVERLLSNYCGRMRAENIFCVPVYKSSRLIHCLSGLFEQKTFSTARMISILSQFNEELRYGAINFHSLWKHGTLEFRMLRGEYRAPKIKEWLNILLSIKKYAMENKEAEIRSPNQLYSSNCEEYVHNIFGELSVVLLYDGYERDIVKGARIAQEVINRRVVGKKAVELLEVSKTTTVKRKEKVEENTALEKAFYGGPLMPHYDPPAQAQGSDIEQYVVTSDWGTYVGTSTGTSSEQTF